MAVFNARLVISGIDRFTVPFKSISKQASIATDQFKLTSRSLRDVQDRLSDIKAFHAHKTAATNIKKEWVEAKKKLEVLKEEFDKAQKPSAELRKNLQRQEQEVRRLGNQHEALTEKVTKAAGKLKELGITKKNIGQETRRLRLEEERLTQTLDRQKKVMEFKTNQEKARDKAVEKRDKSFASAQSLAVVGQTAVGFGRGIFDRLSSPFQTAMNFEAQMSAVSAKALTDIKDPVEQAKELERLKNIAIELGGSTSFSASEVAKAQEILAMAGVSYKDITQETLQGLLDTAKAGELGLEEATDIATGVVRGFGMDIKDLGKVGDVLAYTANVSSTSIGEMGETFKYVSPVAKAAGVDLKATSSMIAVLANVGIKGSMAGTSLKNVILGLSAPTSSAAKVLKGLHIQTRDAHKNMRPLSAVLGDLAQKMKGMGSAERLEKLEKIFGRESLAGATALVDKAGTAEGMKELQQIELGFQNVEGSAGRMGALLSNNTKNAFEQLSGAVETLTIKALDQLLPRLADIVSAITESIGVLTDYAAQYPDFTSGVIAAGAAIGGLAIASGVAMQAWAVMKMSLATLKFGFTTATIAFKGFRFAVVMGSRMMAFAFRGMSTAMVATGIGAIIVGLGIAAWAIYENWDTLREFFLSFWDEIKPVWDAAYAIIKPFIGLWDKFFGKGPTITATMPSAEEASFVTGKGGLNNPLNGAMANTTQDFSVTAENTFYISNGMTEGDVKKAVKSAMSEKQLEQERRARANTKGPM